MKITIEVSPQAGKLLKQIARFGLWGTTVEEVASRFVDKILVQDFVQTGMFQWSRRRKKWQKVDHDDRAQT